MYLVNNVLENQIWAVPLLHNNNASFLLTNKAARIIILQRIDLIMSKDNKNIVIAAGGTGGHIFPAVSLMENLNKIGFIKHFTVINIEFVIIL